MKKILIKNGYLIDPGSGIKGNYDVLVENNRIARVEHDITCNNGYTVINAQGKYITPGFIDLQVNPGETIEYITNILPFCGITTPLIMPCSIRGVPIMDYYGGLESMINRCDGQITNIATAISVEPSDTRGHETFARLGVPLPQIASRIEEFIQLGITAIGEVVLPLGGIAHITSDMSEEFLDRLLDECETYDIPILLHTGAGLSGIEKAVEVCNGRKMHLCHIGSTCAQDNIHKAIHLLEANPGITTDTHLSEVAGSTSRNSKLVLEYYNKGEVVKIDPATLKVTVVKDLESTEPPFYYNKTNLFENNVTCALSDRIEAIECDELGDGIRARIMLKNLFKLVKAISLDHSRINLLYRLIKKLTSNPARILNLKDRGTLQEGSFADILILDLSLEKVNTTIVNGVTVMSEGKLTGQKPGRRIGFRGELY